MADRKTSVSDYERGKADAYADVIRRAEMAFGAPDAKDRRLLMDFVRPLRRLTGYAALPDTELKR